MVSIRIPNLAPRVQQDPRGAPQFTAPGVTTQQNAQPQQMQQLGEGLQQAGAGAMRAGDYLTDVRNDAVATKHLNTYLARLSSLENEAKTLTGENAIKRIPQIREEIKALRGEFAGDTFENAAQERMFSDQADRYQINLNASLEGWERRQTIAFNIGQQDTLAKQNYGLYLLNWHDEKIGAQAKHDALLAVTKKGEMEGWDDKTLDLKLMEATTAMHGGVLSDLLKGNNTKAAQDYFAKNEKEMLGDARQDMARQIKLSGDRDMAWNIANSKDLPSDFMGRIDAINQLRAGEKITTEQWQQAVTFAAQQQNFREEGMRQAKVDLLTAVDKHYAATPSDPLPTDLQTKVQDLGLLDDARARRDNARSTDAGRQTLLDLSTDSEPLKDQSWNDVVLRYGRYLGPEDRDKTLRELWESANGVRGRGSSSAGTGVGGGAGGSEAVYSNEQEVLHFYRLWAGDDAALRTAQPGFKTTLNWTKFDNFQSMWTRQLAEAERSSGKKLSVPEKEELIAKLKLRNKGLRGDEEVNFLNLTAEEQLGFRFSQETGTRGAELREVVAKPDEFNQFNASKSMLTESARLALQKHDEGRPKDQRFGRYNARGELDYEATGYLPFLQALDWARGATVASAKAAALNREMNVIRSNEATARSLQQRNAAVQTLVEKNVPPGSAAWLFVTNGTGGNPGESFNDTLDRLIKQETKTPPYDTANLSSMQVMTTVVKEDAELIQRVEPEFARLTALAAEDPSWQSELDDYKRSKAYARYLKVKSR